MLQRLLGSSEFFEAKLELGGIDFRAFEQVRQDILSPGRPTRWKSATIFYLAKSIYLKQSLHIKRSLTAHPGKTLNTAAENPARDYVGGWQ